MEESAPTGRRTWPVFLVGCHRSGTTLARFILDAHPEIACPPESKFISALHELMGAPQVLPALLSLRLRPAEIVQEFGMFARRLLDLSARNCGKRRWVDKTPNYYRILPFIDDIFRAEVLFIFIVRHPMDAAISLNQHFRFATGRHDDPEIARVVGSYGSGLQCWARYWRDVYETIASFAASCPGRCHVFRYEDLVEDPERVLPGLFAFMDEPIVPDLVTRAFQVAHDKGYEDTKIRLTQAIHGKSVGRWKSLSQDQLQAIWPIVGETATRFGYTLDEDTEMHGCDAATGRQSQPSARKSIE